MQLVEAVSKAKAKFYLSLDARVVSCYEAGRDGFWLHRYLVSLGIENQVVDSSSIFEADHKFVEFARRTERDVILELDSRLPGELVYPGLPRSVIATRAAVQYA